MITLKIKNWFQKDPDYKEEFGIFYRVVNESEAHMVEPYDTEKWKDGRTYEFNTLREVKELIDSCHIEFTEEFKTRFNQWSWYVMDFDITIDPSEDNLMVFSISCHEEWRD